jgi:hypothetical protein
MRKFILAIVGAVAVLGLVAQSAEARTRHASGYPHITIGPFDLGDARIAVAAVIAGVAMTGTYFAIDHVRQLRVPGDGRNFSTGAFALTTVGCMTIAPMLASAIVWNTQGRYLTNREAMGLGAGCMIPFLGSLVIDAMYDAHPGWER